MYKGLSLLGNDLIVQLAEKYSATSAQIVLSWGVLRETSVIPKSDNEDRLRENITVSILRQIWRAEGLILTPLLSLPRSSNWMRRTSRPSTSCTLNRLCIARPLLLPVDHYDLDGRVSS